MNSGSNKGLTDFSELPKYADKIQISRWLAFEEAICEAFKKMSILEEKGLKESDDYAQLLNKSKIFNEESIKVIGSFFDRDDLYQSTYSIAYLFNQMKLELEGKCDISFEYLADTIDGVIDFDHNILPLLYMTKVLDFYYNKTANLLDENRGKPYLGEWLDSKEMYISKMLHGLFGEDKIFGSTFRHSSEYEYLETTDYVKNQIFYNLLNDPSSFISLFESQKNSANLLKRRFDSKYMIAYLDPRLRMTVLDNEFTNLDIKGKLSKQNLTEYDDLNETLSFFTSIVEDGKIEEEEFIGFGELSEEGNALLYYTKYVSQLAVTGNYDVGEKLIEDELQFENLDSTVSFVTCAVDIAVKVSETLEKEIKGQNKNTK